LKVQNICDIHLRSLFLGKYRSWQEVLTGVRKDMSGDIRQEAASSRCGIQLNILKVAAALTLASFTSPRATAQLKSPGVILSP
jgi:hypothetical protein